MRLSRRLTAGSLLLLVAGFASAGSVGFSLKDALGTEHSSAEFSKAKATVLMFVATDCPNSNTYAPVLARLYREYSPRGVAFFNVYSDPSESAATVRKHDADFPTPFAALLDPHQTLARRNRRAIDAGSGDSRSRRAAALSRTRRQPLRRSRQTRYQPTENDLQEALDAILHGKAVPHPVTRDDRLRDSWNK